jgi:hypothetical protein
MEMFSAMLIKDPFNFCVEMRCVFFRQDPSTFLTDKMQLNFIHFLALAILALLVHANPTPGLRADDNEPAEALCGILDNSIDFSAKAEAIVIPRIEEWLVQKPFQSSFSAITNSTSVFKKLVEYVVESEKSRNQNASFVYSSNDNVTTVEFEKGPVKDVNLTLLFRASEHRFLASEFHKLCDRQGATPKSMHPQT